MVDTSNERPPERRLNSWKEIAAFFGKDERTVKRWESARGLPVRRVPGGTRTSVFAYAGELEQWLSGSPTRAEGLTAETGRLPVAAASVLPRRLPGPYLALLAAALFLLGLATSTLVPGLWSGSAATTPPATAMHTPAPAARDLYFEAVYLWEKRTADSLREAETLFRRAIEIDPAYAQAWAGLANTYNLLREYSAMPAAEAYAAAVEAGRKAVALNPTDADAMSALAFAEFYGLRLIEEGIARFEAARAVDPESPKIHHWLGNALLHLGRFVEALAEIEEAQRLDPSSRSIRASMGLAYFCAGRITEATALLTEMARLEPDFLSPHAYLAYLHLAQGDYPAYLAALEKMGSLREDSSRNAVAAAGRRGYAESGRDGMIKAMLTEEQREVRAGRSLIYNVARLEALAGDVTAALRSLKASVDAGEEHVMGINIDPAFRLIRSNPEFRDFAAGFGLPIVQ
jgi:tetratricopeptide (TPR) repeat protein